MKKITRLLASTAISLTAVTSGWTADGVKHNTQAFFDVLSRDGGKPLEQLSLADARKALVGAQAGAKFKLPKVDVSRKTITVNGNEIKLVIVRPVAAKGTLPVFMFFHGGGWVLGDFPTHQRLVSDLVAGSGAVGVFVDYTPSPEVGYGVAINQAYDATKMGGRAR